MNIKNQNLELKQKKDYRKRILSSHRDQIALENQK